MDQGFNVLPASKGPMLPVHRRSHGEAPDTGRNLQRAGAVMAMAVSDLMLIAVMKHRTLMLAKLLLMVSTVVC